MTPTEFSDVLDKHVPEGAKYYCFSLWQRYPFKFKLRKNRVTKVGDFTCYPGKTPVITVNHDLDPYLFLITYVHEVAHLVVHIAHGNKVESHGQEWKKTFQLMMEPIMTDTIFPDKLLHGLRKHMQNPKASTFSDSHFTQLLRQFDERQKDVVLLSHIPEGSVFGYHGRWFRKGKLRRTRVECRELNSKAKYLVPADVPVTSAQLSLL